MDRFWGLILVSFFFCADFLGLLQKIAADVEPGEVNADDALEFHNIYRRNHVINADNEEEDAVLLQWDPGLAKHAQDYAKELAERDPAENLSPKDHSPEARESKTMSENLSWHQTSELMGKKFTAEAIKAAVKNAVDAWYEEYYCYQYDDPHVPKIKGAQIGHFEAMIWKAMTLVGVGIARKTTGSQGHYVVANYGPNMALNGDVDRHAENILRPKEEPPAKKCQPPGKISWRSATKTESDGTKVETSWKIFKQDDGEGTTKVTKTIRKWRGGMEAGEPFFTKTFRGGKELLPKNSEPGQWSKSEHWEKKTDGQGNVTKVVTTVETFTPADMSKKPTKKTTKKTFYNGKAVKP